MYILFNKAKSNMDPVKMYLKYVFSIVVVVRRQRVMTLYFAVATEVRIRFATSFFGHQDDVIKNGTALMELTK